MPIVLCVTETKQTYVYIIKEMKNTIVKKSTLRTTIITILALLGLVITIYIIRQQQQVKTRADVTLQEIIDIKDPSSNAVINDQNQAVYKTTSKKLKIYVK